MKTRSRIIAVLSILLLCAGLFVACSADVADSAAAEAGKTAYLSFGNGLSKAIGATSIGQEYSIKPVSEVYWVYKATKADHAGSTGATGGAYLPVKTFAPGLDGKVGPFSVGKWTFDLIGYVGCADTQGQIPSGEDAISVTIDNVTKYYYGTIYEAHSAIITLSESTSENPQVVSVDVVFAGTGDGTIVIRKGEFYWVADNGGDVAGDGNMLRIHLTLSQEINEVIVDQYDEYFNLVAQNYSNGIRYTLADAINSFAAASGNYVATFAVEKWSVSNNEPVERVGYVSGASDVSVTVYAKQTLKIDAQFLESVFGYVTFDGITPSPVLVQRLVLKTAAGNLTVSETQTISHDGLSVTYPDGTKLSEGTKKAEDGKTADATTGFVYANTNPPVNPSTEEIIDIGTGNSNLKYELTLNVDVTNTTVLTVTKNIGTGRDIQSVYHNGNPMTIASGSGDPVADTYSYNSATGILTLYVTHASPIDVVYKPAVNTDVASITRGTGTDAKTYYFSTIAEAVDAAEYGDTIKLLKDVEFNNASQSKSVFYDLNSHVFTDCPETILNGNLFAVGLFAGGAGTESNPYSIANGNQWYNLLTAYQGYYMGSSTSGLYIALVGDVDITGYDISDYNSNPRNFHLDGNGFTMKNFVTSIWGDDGTLYLTNSFTDLKLENCHSPNNSLFGGTQNSNTASVTFTNVDLNNCSAVGGAYQYYDGSATATFINCDATNTAVLGDYMASGGFVGNISTGTIVIDNCSFGGSVVSTQSSCGGFVGQSANYVSNKVAIRNSTIIGGTVIRNVAGGSVAAFDAQNGTIDYKQFNNAFYGILETAGKAYKQGTEATTQEYTPICTVSDFEVDSTNGTLIYTGSAELGKIKVQAYVTDDYIYYGTYYGGYNWFVCDPIVANNISYGSVVSGIPVITDFYNVVSSTSTPVGLQTTDTTHVDEIYNGVFYFDARTYSWGHYMLGGTYKNGVAVNPTSMNVYIKITVYDDSNALIGVLSGATLKYTVDLSNHGN